MFGAVIILVSCVLCVAVGQPQSNCKDLDEQACLLFSKAKPDLCTDDSFSQSTCRRFCGNCPLECYSCPTPVLDPDDCNTTTTCPVGQTCMTKHLLALDGHHEYIMSCEEKKLCEGLSFGFGALIGKREIMFDEETEDDVEIHGRKRRDVSLSCCDTDFCNFPIKTTTPAPTTTTTLPPTSAGPFPHGCKRDIVFLIDDSGSVGTTNFKHSLDLISNIIQQINIGPNDALTSVIPYSTRPLTSWYLNTYNNKHNTLNALSHIHYVGGTTHTNDALELVRTSILTQNRGDRPDAENVVVVLTDGRSNNKIDTIREANNLHHISKDVISVVIGSGIDVQELNAIATDNHHVFDVRSYNNLHSIVTQLLDIICNA